MKNININKVKIDDITDNWGMCKALIKGLKSEISDEYFFKLLSAEKPELKENISRFTFNVTEFDEKLFIDSMLITYNYLKVLNKLENTIIFSQENISLTNVLFIFNQMKEVVYQIESIISNYYIKDEKVKAILILVKYIITGFLNSIMYYGEVQSEISFLYNNKTFIYNISNSNFYTLLDEFKTFNYKLKKSIDG